MPRSFRGPEDIFKRSRMDVTDLHQIHWPDPEGDVEETDAASPGSCDTFQFDSDVATVYLSDIRERKEREWLYCSGKFPR